MNAKGDIVSANRISEKKEGIGRWNGNRIAGSAGFGLIESSARHHLAVGLINAWRRASRPISHREIIIGRGLIRSIGRGTRVREFWSAILCSRTRCTAVSGSIWDVAAAGRHIAGNDARFVLVDCRGPCSVSRMKLESVLKLMQSVSCRPIAQGRPFLPLLPVFACPTYRELNAGIF